MLFLLSLCSLEVLAHAFSPQTVLPEVLICAFSPRKSKTLAPVRVHVRDYYAR